MKREPFRLSPARANFNSSTLQTDRTGEVHTYQPEINCRLGNELMNTNVMRKQLLAPRTRSASEFGVRTSDFGRPRSAFRFSPGRALLTLSLLALVALLGGAATVNGSTFLANPIVAIHDSEWTRALEMMTATNSTTPTGSGTTGKEWWPTNWHYFVMPESIKEALRSDGTAFAVVGDSNIVSGALVDANGQPRYPIVISLAAEAATDAEIAQLTNYVAKGGTLLVGSSAFTRQTNGAFRGDCALASQMGVKMVTPTTLTNWTSDSTLTTITNHPVVSRLPAGTLTWQMPFSADDISWGISPAHSFPPGHLVWQVTVTDATVLAQGDDSTIPYLAVKQYGAGNFIYHAAMQPVIGHGGYAPGMYAYGIFRSAIEWAFANAQCPVPKVSPWPYPYDAALEVRHDLEDFQDMITNLEASAHYEWSNGVRGDYYFCTGTLREEMTNGYGVADPAVIASLQSAVTSYGATIGPHNGGLPDPNNLLLVLSDYDYWHWGPDEALDDSPAGYASGLAYAQTSVSNSFNDMEGWLAGTGNGNGLRTWAAPYFNSTRDASYNLLDQLNVKTAGEQKMSPFPHGTFSTQTAGKRYGFVSLPTSEWWNGNIMLQKMEDFVGYGGTNAVDALVDAYYDLGALINLYSHTGSDGIGHSGDSAGDLTKEYIGYSMKTYGPQLWAANAPSIYSWWMQRANMQITPSCDTNGSQVITTLSISGAADPQAAVEIFIPTNTFSGLQVFTNRTLAAGTNSYRANGQTVKVLVGKTVTDVEIVYTPGAVSADDVLFSDDFTRGTDPGPLTPWVAQAGTWTVTGGVLLGGPNTASSYGDVYYANSWSDYSVQAQFQFPAGAYGGGLGGRLDPTTGAHYAAWIYPEGSSGGSSVLKLVNFQNWTNFNVLQTVNLAGVGTSWHTLTLSFSGSQITVSYDANQVISVTDTSYSSGGISLDMWTDSTPYVMAVDNVLVATAAGGGTASKLAILSVPTSATAGQNFSVTVQSQDTNGNPANVVQATGVLLASSGSGTLSGKTGTINAGANSVTLTSVQDPKAETITLTASSTSGDNLSTSAASPSIQVNAGKTNQSITFGPLANKSYGDPPFTVSATASSGLPVTFSILPGPATIAGNTVTVTGTGTVTVEAAQSGNTNYNAATPVDQSFTVGPAADGTVFADNFAHPGSLSPWVAAQGNWAVTTNNMLQGTNSAGGYNFTYVAGNWTNYTLQGQIQFSSTNGYGGGLGGYLQSAASGAHYGAWVYPESSTGGSNVLKLIKFEGSSWGSWSGTPMATNGLPGVGTNWHTLKLAFSNTNQISVYYDGLEVLTNVTDNNFDSLPAYLGGGITADMYTDTNAYVMSVSNVTVKLIQNSLTVTGITAVNKVYDGGTTATLNTNNAALVGVNGGDQVTLILTNATGAFADKNVGTNKTVTVSGLTLGGPDAGKYTLTQPTATANITPLALTVSGITASNKVYDTTTVATLNTTSAVLTGNLDDGNVVLSTVGAIGTFTPDGKVGSSKTVQVSGLTISGSATNNYTLTQPTATANITPLALTVSGITASNKVYNATTVATLNTTSAALVGNLDDGNVVLSTAGAIGTFTPDGKVGTSKTVQVSGLTISGSATNNYTLTQPTATANITPLALTVSGITASNKVYDATTVARLNTTSAALVGNLDDGSVVLGTAGAIGTFTPDGTVGANKTVQVSGLTISGSATNNYTLTQPTATANITPLALTVSGITASNKVYDATTVATLNTTSAALVGNLDDGNVVLSTAGATGTFTPDGTVGTNKTVQVSGLTISGSATNNYTLTQPTTTANITQAPLTVTGITAANKVYDGTTTATLNTTNATLVGNLDDGNVVLSTAGAFGAFDTKNVGTNKNVTVSGLTISGARASDYTLVQPTITASITPAGLLVTGITASNKVYDATTVATLSTSNAALVRVPPLPARPGDIGFSFLSSTNTTGNANNYISTPSFQVGSNCLALAAIVNSDTTLTPTNFSGNGLSWQRILTTNFDTLTSPTMCLTVYAAMSNNISAPGRATVRFTGNQTGCNIYICEFTNVWFANGALGAIVQASARAANSSVNPSNVLSALAAGGQNALVAFFGGASNPFNATPPTGWTEDADMGYNTPSTGLGAYHLLQTTNNTLVLTRAASAWASAMMELRSLNVGPAQGPLGGDNVTLVTGGATGTFTNADVGVGETVQIAGLTISGTDAGNYTLTQPTTTANITPAPLAVTATDTNKVYGSTLGFAGTEFRVTGTLDGDTVTNVTLTSAGAPATATVGSYAITPSAAQGDGLSNYTISYTNGTLTVNPAALTVTATGPSKTYGTALTAGTSTANFTASATQNGETVTSVTLTPNAAGLSATTAAGAAYVVTPSAATGGNGFSGGQLQRYLCPLQRHGRARRR